MRIAATLTPMRDAARQPVSLRATLRDGALAPHEVTILDLSASGFMAELPDDMQLAPGERVRIAATPLGVHEAVAVRVDGGGHGFAFVRSIGGDALVAAEGEQASSVTAFPLAEAQRMPAPAGLAVAGGAVAMMPASLLPVPPAAPAHVGAERQAISARASLALITMLSMGLWALLALALWLSYPFVG